MLSDRFYGAQILSKKLPYEGLCEGHDTFAPYNEDDSEVFLNEKKIGQKRCVLEVMQLIL